MHIKQICSQHRRDFTAIYECEHCGASYRAGGYDDANFHDNVVPSMECRECGKSAGEGYKPRLPIYPEGMQI